MASPLKTSLQFGPFQLDPAERRLRRHDVPVPLSPKAFDLLLHFARRPKQVLTREQLFQALWPDTHVDDHALSVQISEIRRALGDSVQEPQYIETRHRRGYCFKATVTEVPALDPPAAASAAAPLPAAAIPETRYARSGDVNIAYQVLGRGPLDLVFVMGWVSQLESFWAEPRFARFLQRLASVSRLICFDKRGTGLSDRVPEEQLPSIEQRMDDLRAVMDAANSSRAVLCGVSEGGCMAAAFAATHPEKTRGLIMIGSYARRLRAPDYPWAPTPEQRDLFLQEIRDHWGGPVGIEVRAPSLANDPAFRQWWASYLRLGASPAAAVALTRMNSKVDIRPVLPLIQVPSLVLHRSGDRCLKVEEGRYLASLIPGVRYVELPGDDHLPFVGQQDEILAPIETFLEELRTSPETQIALATVLVASVEGDAFRSQLPVWLQRFGCVSSQVAGGSVVATFDGPARAVRCACSIRDQAAQLGLVARAGLHIGECLSTAQPSPAGPAVRIATEIHARCNAGDVLVSGTLRDLIVGSSIGFVPHGRLELAGLGEWQLLHVPPPSHAAAVRQM